jgi:hypothetical protein
MADLIAFLHSGKGAKATASGAHPGMTGMAGMGGQTAAARGKGVFLSAGCGACHTVAAAGTKATVGPNLDTALRGKNSAFVRTSILDPNAAIAANSTRPPAASSRCWLGSSTRKWRRLPRLLGDRANRADLDRLLVERARLERIDVADAARAAVIAPELRTAVEEVLESAHAARWQLTLTERDAVELVMHLCRRFPRYVRRLVERHAGRPALAIADEYDLQDHVHALPRLHFDDVRPEEWTPSYAWSRTRMDFLLKRGLAPLR